MEFSSSIFIISYQVFLFFLFHYIISKQNDIILSLLVEYFKSITSIGFTLDDLPSKKSVSNPSLFFFGECGSLVILEKTINLFE